ncbi:hypothetical protein VTK73DRAFT_5369 [Phialemonium thermophilum]|uniref:ER membrane protein complex subunit 1 n=1 Tax=Phialemonium thermophilum TaxID=223376 RepID=A0ABR3Y8X1_9PEZI
MLSPGLVTTLLWLLPSAVRAVFKDEVGHLDYHYELLGLPQRETTFFHKPRREDKASLLYTLSDLGVLAAVNPSNGALLWRQILGENATYGAGFARAAEGESWISSAFGGSVHAWDAVNGRSRFWAAFDGQVKDLEVLELTENGRKDILALHDDSGATVVRRINGNDGSVVWEFRESNQNIPLQVSTNVEKVFLVSLHGSWSAYNLKVSALDTRTGRRLDDFVLGTKGEVHSEKDVMFVGANSAIPVLAWTDESRSKLRINVLGTKNRQEFPLVADTVAVEIHAANSMQAVPHFLVHTLTSTGHRADVYHVDLKSNTISKAYELAHLPGHGAFSTSSDGANVFFTRITDDEVILTSSVSHGILGRWPLRAADQADPALHAVSEVVKKPDNTYAIRAAAVTDSDSWMMIRNGELAWTRPEGMSGAVAAVFAEIPTSEELVKSLEQEAHINPLSAYVHRVKRHLNDLGHLPGYLRTLPERLLSSILGKDVANHVEGLVRDNFGFHKLVILATQRGRLYAIDTGSQGRIVWSQRPFTISAGDKWQVKGIYVDETKGHVIVRGDTGEHITVETETGRVVEVMPRGSARSIQSTALVTTPSGKHLLPIGAGGHVGVLPAHLAPKETVVVQGTKGELKGLVFIAKGAEAHEVTSWVFSPPKSQRIVHVATRPSHDPVASIGRVLGDRRVKYKYLNPNTAVISAADDQSLTLTVYLLDTVSGEILFSATHEGVDTSKHAECSISENWFLCTFFGRYTIKDTAGQSFMGYQIVVSDLYESNEPNDRGPLGTTANFSSLNPVDRPIAPARPSVISQSFVVSAPMAALQVTQTRQGISTREVLAYLPETHGIIGLPRTLLEPRRPVDRDPTPAEVEEGLVKYSPVIDLDPKLMITHERDVIGVRKIIVSPAVVESTSLVFAFGIDVFGTRVAPSYLFDILGKGFNKVSMIGTVLALTVGVLALGPMVRRKQTNTVWQPST